MAKVRIVSFGRRVQPGVGPGRISGNWFRTLHGLCQSFPHSHSAAPADKTPLLGSAL